jgi:hypothetical protein
VERTAGALLAELKRAQGQRTDPCCPNCETSDQAAPKSFAAQVADKGISLTQAKRWQQFAAVPEEQFERALAAPDCSRRPTRRPAGVVAPTVATW